MLVSNWTREGQGEKEPTLVNGSKASRGTKNDKGAKSI